MEEMNTGESASLFADEGEYERRTRNRVVISEEGKRFVKLGLCMQKDREAYNGVWRGGNA